MIFHCLDGAAEGPARRKILVWIPAHTALSAVGHARTSAGGPITAVLWRANRLVDAFAKRAAARGANERVVLKLIKSFHAAARHGAAALGYVTSAANHFSREVVQTDVSVKVVTARDSAPAPRELRGPPPGQAASLGDVVRLAPPPAATAPARKASVAEHAAAARLRSEAAFWASWEPAARRARAGPTAAERVAALRARVSARSGAAAAPSGGAGGHGGAAASDAVGGAAVGALRASVRAAVDGARDAGSL